MIEIKETSVNDIGNVRRLWADGEVMRFVGFPDGLHKTDEEMNDWLCWIESLRPSANHFSIYENDTYCGEAFYEIDKEHGARAALDIKLFPFARGRGIAARALRYAIDQAISNGASKCYVDPHPENEHAIALYRRLGMTQKEMPEDLLDPDFPGFLYFEIER